MMLSDSLALRLYQCPVPLKDRTGSVLALERFINSHRLRKLIREGKPRQIRARLQSGAEDFVSIDIALADPCKQDLIAFENGLVHVEDRQFFTGLVQMPGERRAPVK